MTYQYSNGVEEIEESVPVESGSESDRVKELGSEG